jgi:hypothetical protein
LRLNSVRLLALCIEAPTAGAVRGRWQVRERLRSYVSVSIPPCGGVRSGKTNQPRGHIVLTDRYGLALSTQSEAARDAFVLACDRALTLYPGATAAFDQAVAADPGFALAQAGKAQVLLREGNVVAARQALAAAKDLVGGVTSTSYSQGERRQQSPPCTRIYRIGHATRSWWPAQRIPTA